MRLKLTWTSIFVLILLVTSCDEEIINNQEIEDSSARLKQVQSFYPVGYPVGNQKKTNQK